MQKTSPSADSGAGAQPSPRRSLPQIPIAVKLLSGYLALSVVIVAIAALSLKSIEKVNFAMRSITTAENPLIEVSDGMFEAVLAEDDYGRRFTNSDNTELLVLFNEQGAAFDRLLEAYKTMMVKKRYPPETLGSLHYDYRKLFEELFAYQKALNTPEARNLDNALRQKRAELTEHIVAIAAEAARTRNAKIRESARTGEKAYQGVLLFSGLFMVLAVILTVLITKNIAGPVRVLQRATRKIAAGQFDVVPQVGNRDELGELARSFSAMSRRLRELEELLVDMNPLTRIPGSIAIERTLTSRITAGKPFAFCHFDLDNFKAYGDKYGYARGSEVIKATAGIIEQAVRAEGTPEDFIGHVGGDDFVAITTPDRYEAICRAVIAAFDASVPSFYNEEDRVRGCIRGKTRQGVEMDFPLMSISIGVVTNRERRIGDPLEVGEIAAELKEMAKSRQGSNMVVDTGEGGPA